MTFRITWSTRAFNEMDAILRLYPARKAVFAAALKKMAAALASDPLGYGESRERDYRIEYFAPLVIDYRVIQTADRVVIADVRLRKPFN